MKTTFRNLIADDRGEANPFLVLGGIAVSLIVAAFGILQVPGWVKAAKAAEAEARGETVPADKTPDPVAVDTATQVDMSSLWSLLGVVVVCLIVFALLTGGITIVTRRVLDAAERRLTAKTSRERQTASWALYRERHNALLAKIVHAETDWDTLFYFPAINDPSVDETYAMLKAMRDANTLRDTDGELPVGLAAGADLNALPYPRAVEAFALAWDVAEKHARRVGQSLIPEEERKKIEQAQDLLRVAQDSGAYPVERELAYRRAQSLLKELTSIHVPERAVRALEESKVLMLTSA